MLVGSQLTDRSPQPWMDQALQILPLLQGPLLSPLLLAAPALVQLEAISPQHLLRLLRRWSLPEMQLDLSRPEPGGFVHQGSHLGS